MTTFLGFLKNNMTGEEFVAPTECDSRNDAEWQLVREYPQGIYSLLTIYSYSEMKRVMADVERWPGMPSKVQPKIEDLMANVRVNSRSLPPMPNQRMAEIDGGRIEKVRAAVSGQRSEVQELAARLLAAELHGRVPGSQPTYSHSSVTDSRPVAPKAPSIPAVAMPQRPMRAPQGESAPSLISVLKAMRR